MDSPSSCLESASPPGTHGGLLTWSLRLGTALLTCGLLWLAAGALAFGRLAPPELEVGLGVGLAGLAAGYGLLHRHIASTLRARRTKAAKLARLAFFDHLTGLPNRALLQDRLHHSLAEAQRFGHPLGVLFLDLDRFKDINDSLGHAAGDALLRIAAKRMQNSLRNNDTVARFAGDEFVIILSGFRALKNVPHIALKLLHTLSQPYHLEGREVRTSASLGIAVYPQDGDNADQLMRAADAAMYAAKQAKGDTFRFFSADMERKLGLRLEMESCLQQALDQDEFFLLYQPQFDMRRRRLVGFEALVRWNHPTKGILPPDQFIGLAEETGLIGPLGNWILRQACRQWHSWQAVAGRPLRLAINLASQQLHADSLAAEIAAILNETGMPPRCLELEVTESALMHNPDLAGQILGQLKALGVQLCIDDFGSGYFSLPYLQDLPIDRLKIAPAIVQGGPCDNGQASIAATIIDLARHMNLQLVAEGVESASQIEFLLQRGCPIGQGYFFAAPLDEDGITDFIEGLPGSSPNLSALRPGH